MLFHGPLNSYVAAFIVVLMQVLVLWGSSSEARLIPQPPLILSYHDGPLLGGGGAVSVNILWYGDFSKAQKNAVRDFFSSIETVPKNHGEGSNSIMSGIPEPVSVSSWWSVVGQYRDSRGRSAATSLRLGTESADSAYSMGKSLSRGDIECLVDTIDDGEEEGGLNLVLTLDDVTVEGFCMNSCARHSVVGPAARAKSGRPYAWVGNPASQCPGRCAWPFAAAQEYGPRNSPLSTALVPPNGDAGIDGLIINMAAILAGAVTNPYGTGFYQGDESVPFEAATACMGVFGPGAFPGYPGKLTVDQITGASFNSHGVNGRKFLLPALWNPSTLSCNVLTITS
ncbi:hypothetical protein R1flu_023077 [Riccia fluitans]|uniref:Protein EXORDIUM-like 2 n=1 Tax=Riccia fluitans TaxID=41844 RepID=A0ABD1XR22_9MARC